MMGYDHENRYFNPEETTLSTANAKQLVEKWRFTVAGFPAGSPVIAEGKVFAMSTGATYAIDLEKGTEIWARTDLAGTASVAYEAGFVYVHTYQPANTYKLKASDGSTVWGPTPTYDMEFADGESSPIVAGGKVIIGHCSIALEASITQPGLARGGVEALDAETGKLLWTYYTVPDSRGAGENGASVWSSATVDLASGTVFATTGNNFSVTGPNSDAIHAIDLATGEKRWVTQVRKGDLSLLFALGADSQAQDTDFGANPILLEVEGRRIVAAGDKGSAFWALDRESGEILWSRDKLSNIHNWLNGGVLMNGASDGSHFYVVSNEPNDPAGAVLHKLDPTKNGASVWKHAFDQLTWGAVSLANGLLLVPSGTTLHVMSAQTGEILTSFETGGTIAGGAAAIAQGRIVVKSGLQYIDVRVQNNNQIICYGLPSSGGGTAGTAGSGTAGSGTAGTGGTSGSSSGSPKWNAIYQEIIVNTGCNGGACHSGTAAGGLNMSSRDLAHTNLIGMPAMGTNPAGTASTNCAGSGVVRVVPSNPDGSLLMTKLEHTQPCGGPMPSANTKLQPQQLQQVRSWIANGATND